MTGYSAQGSVVVRKVRTGKDGRDSVRFYLTVSPQNFTVDTHGNIKETDKTVKVQAWTCVGTGIPAKASDNDVYLTVVPVKADGTKANAIFAKSQASCSFTVSKTYAKYIVTLFNGVDKGNEWDSREVVIGNDGQNTVRLDLDNENDSILYDGAGNKLSADVVTNATLYDGGTAYTKSPVTFSIPEGGQVNCKAEISGNKVTVKELTDTTAQVIIHAYYETLAKTYEAVFSIKKLVGVDKYDLVVSPNAVAYNTTTGKVQTGSSISVQVYRTPSNGGKRENVKSLSDYNLAVSCSPNLIGTYANGKATVSVSDTNAKDNANIILTLTKDGVTQDSETIPIVKAVDGTNSVRIDLDNENDSILYDGSGTRISDKVVTTPHLYDGNTEKTSDATWSISAKSNVTIENESSWKGGALTVSDISATTGSVTIQAEYPKNSGKKYTCVFSIKKLVGVDKYDLDVTPNSISYNTSDGTGSSKDVTIRVWRTKQNGSRENIATLPTGYKLLINGTNYAGSYKNQYYTFTAGVNVDSHTVILTDGTNTLDAETIPVLKAINGTSPYKLDLTNENTMVNCDYNGNVLSGAKYETSKVQILHGTKDGFADFTISVEADGITHGYNSTTHILNPSAITKDVATITVTATGKNGTEAAGLTLSAVMTVTKNKPGKPGESPVYYSLIPSHGVIHKDKDGSFLDTTMNFKVLKVEGTTQTMLDTYAKLYTEGIKLYCSGFSTAINNNNTSTSAVVITCSTYFTANHREFYIMKGSVEWDREGIDVVSDGKNGGPGPEGKGYSYYLQMVNTSIKFDKNGKVSDDDISGYAWRLSSDGTRTAVALSTTNTYVHIKCGSNSGILSYEDTNKFYTDSIFFEKSLNSQFVELTLFVDSKAVASHTFQIMLPGADGFNYLPINNGLYDDSKSYTWNTEKRDFIDYQINGEWKRFGVASFGKVVPANTPPTTTDKAGDGNWKIIEMDVQTFLVNCMFATNANIGGLLASQENLRSSILAYRLLYKGNFTAASYGLVYYGDFVLGTSYPYKYRGISIYPMVRYNGTYYKSKVSYTPDTSKYPSANTTEWQVCSSSDYAAISHPNVEWGIPDASNYTYEAANGASPAIRPVVNYAGKYYTLKGNMLGKTWYYNVFSTNQWRELFDVERINNIVGATSDITKFVLNGKNGTIMMRQPDDTVYTYDETGKQTAGYEDGRKVVIDPSTKSVSVFDDTNKQVITIHGEKKSTIDNSFAGNSGSGSASANATGIYNYATSSGCKVAQNVIYKLSNDFTISGSGGYNLNYKGSISVIANYSESNSWCPDKDKGTLSYIQPLVINSTTYGHQSYCRVELLLVNVDTGSITSLKSIGQGNKGTTNTITFDTNIHIGAGTYYWALKYTYAIYSSGSARITWGKLEYSWAKDVYMGEIFGNGLAFGNNSQNYFAIMKESDTNLHVKCISNNHYGFEVNNSGVKIMVNGTWYTAKLESGQIVFK